MYRQYENPWELEDQLAEAKAIYRRAREEEADEDTLMNLAIRVHELEERVNFAWQDDEFDNEQDY